MGHPIVPYFTLLHQAKNGVNSLPLTGSNRHGDVYGGSSDIGWLMTVTDREILTV